jgi:methionyl-tRNA formyltransferase
MTEQRTVVSPAVAAAGYRGAAFIAGLIGAGVRPVRVFSYRQAADRSSAFDTLFELCRKEKIPFEETRRPDLAAEPLVFLVGWQFRVEGNLENCIVVHDSLLPKLRGFSPTVTALLRGDTAIGVTAFRPVRAFDAGPICGSRTVHVPVGASLQEAFDLQTDAMVGLALELLQCALFGDMNVMPQEDSGATYSLWRDAFDYFIDWRRDAADVVRKVAVLGFPYEGAKGVLRGRLLTIVKARLGPNMEFAIRDPGKLWEIDEGRALVVCGAGTVWVEEAVDADAQPYRFETLRTRFLTADNAWLGPFTAK